MKKILIILFIVSLTTPILSKAQFGELLKKSSKVSIQQPTWQMFKEDEKLKRSVNEVLLKYPIVLKQRDSCEQIAAISDSLKLAYRADAQSCRAEQEKTENSITKGVDFVGLKPLKNKDPIKDIERIIKVAQKRQNSLILWRSISVSSILTTTIILLTKK